MSKLQIPNYKLQTNSKSKFTITKTLSYVCDFGIWYCILFVICLLSIEEDKNDRFRLYEGQILYHGFKSTR